MRLIQTIICMKRKEINRLKEILIEQGRSGKWLAMQLGKDPATVSQWCTNRVQPSLETIDKIAELINVNRKDLIKDSK